MLSVYRYGRRNRGILSLHRWLRRSILCIQFPSVILGGLWLLYLCWWSRRIYRGVWWRWKFFYVSLKDWRNSLTQSYRIRRWLGWYSGCWWIYFLRHGLWCVRGLWEIIELNCAKWEARHFRVVGVLNRCFSNIGRVTWLTVGQLGIVRK